MIQFRSRLFLTATLLFFLSGMVGLGYELIWIRKAALIVGSSQIALATVLTAFFLGLGIGSYIVGNYLRTKRFSPLFLYGLLEVAIGVFALAFPTLFELLESVYASLYPVLEGSATGLFALRFSLLFALFLPPTVFMGGTLPLLLDGLVEKDASIGARTSLLYGINILGAVAGVLLTAYWAIPTFGLNGTSFLGAACNLAIGGVALVAFGRLKPIHVEVERPSLELFFLLAAFASGLLAIAYQICWARFFTLFNTGTVYLTAVLLAVYLLALSAGSFILAPLLARRLQPLRILSVVQALVPIFSLGCLQWWRLAEYRPSILGTLPAAGAITPVAVDTLEINHGHEEFWSFFNETADAVFFAPLFQVTLSIFIPVTLIGVGLPSLIAAATQQSSGLRSISGRLLFWNTLGSSAGGFVAGYALLPLLGLHWTLFTLGLGSLALSVAAWAKGSPAAEARAPASRKERRRQQSEPQTPARPTRPRIGLVLPAAGLVATLVFALIREDISRQTIRDHGYGRDPDMRGGSASLEILEGPLTTSFFFEDDDSLRLGSGNVCLAVAYKRWASSQAIQGHLPCLFYPGSGTPADCLGICLGSGQSFGALLLYDVKTLDVVDISSEIFDLSLRHFGPYSHGLDRDPRVKFHLDDGRHFVDRAPDDSYDVISMEPPPPTAEGVSSLYSVEFYEEVARILRTGGVFMQWLPLYRVTPLDTKGIVKTQAEVFPETFVVKASKDDFMIVSYKEAPKIPLDALRDRVKVFAKERFIQGLRWNKRCRHDISSVEGVLSFLITGPSDVQKMTAPLLYLDDTQILSYTSGDRGLLRRYEGPALSALSFSALPFTSFSHMKDYFEPPLEPTQVADIERERAASLDMFGVPDPVLVARNLQTLETLTDPEARARLFLELATALDGMLAKSEAFQFIEMALEALGDKRDALGEEERLAVRRIVRHAIVAFEDITEEWLGRLAGKYAAQPLLRSMRSEWDAYQRRKAERLGKYLWP